MSDPEDSPSSGVRLEENRDHGMKVLSGLNHLKKEKVLCDVALIAEGKTIQRKICVLKVQQVHKVHVHNMQ